MVICFQEDVQNVYRENSETFNSSVFCCDFSVEYATRYIDTTNSRGLIRKSIFIVHSFVDTINLEYENPRKQDFSKL